MKENKLLNVFCARLSKDGTKVVLTLVCGEGEQREFYNACLALGTKGKINTEVITYPLDNTKYVKVCMPLSTK